MIQIEQMPMNPVSTSAFKKHQKKDKVFEAMKNYITRKKKNS